MEAQEVEVPRAQTQQGEMLEPENRDVDARNVEPPESIAAETEALEAEENETPASEACAGDSDADAEPVRAFEAPTDEVCLEEDETQLAAIRELTTRASARGICLRWPKSRKPRNSPKLRSRRSCGICARRITADTTSRSAAGNPCAGPRRCGKFAMREGVR